MPNMDPPNRWIDHPLAGHVHVQSPWTEAEYKALRIDTNFDHLRILTVGDYRRIDDCSQIHGITAHRRGNNAKIPITGIPRLPDIVHFRSHAQTVLAHYIAQPDAPPAVIPGPNVIGDNVTILKPPYSKTLPMLYRIIQMRGNRTVLLESMIFELFYKREELRFITLDKDSWNRTGGVRGVVLPKCSIGDLVWVYNLTCQHVGHVPRDMQKSLEDAGKRGVCVEELAPVFRALEFDLITPSCRPPVWCYVVKTWKSTAQIAISGEAKHCEITCANNQGHRIDTEGEILECRPRMDTPASFYLATTPIKGNDPYIIRIIRETEPTLPNNQAPRPTWIGPAPDGIKAQVSDQLNRFTAYRDNHRIAMEIMRQRLLLATSYHEVCETNKQDRQRRNAIFVIKRDRENQRIVRFQFEINGKVSAEGWHPGSKIVMSLSVPKMFIFGNVTSCDRSDDDEPQTAKFEALPLECELDRLARFDDGSEHHGTAYLMPSARPKSWIISTLERGFDHLRPTDFAYQAFDAMYSAQRGAAFYDQIPVTQFEEPAGEIPRTFRRKGHEIQMTNEQRQAIDLLSGDYQTGAVFSPFGAGKTAIIGVAAQYRASLSDGTTLLIASTNNALTEAIDAFLETSISEAKREYFVHHHLADGVFNARESMGTMTNLAEQTCVDPETDMCDALFLREFVENRHLLKLYLQGQLDLPESVEEAERVMIDIEYPSKHIKRVYELLCHYRPASVLGLTFGSLNGLLKGLFKEHLDSISSIIVEEASDVSEAGLVALHCLFPNANIYLVGDIRQSQPYTMIRSEDPIHPWAMRPALTVALNSDLVPNVVLTTTYRSHPAITDVVRTMFYRNSFTTPIREADRILFTRRTGLPIVFVLYPGTDHRTHSGSRRSLDEAKLAMRLVIPLLTHFPADQLLLISYYKSQRTLIERMIKENQAIPNKPRFATIGRDPGSQAEVAIVLTTYSGKRNGSAYFNSRHRACFALTRARQGIVVLGTSMSLECGPWGALFDLARLRGWVMDIDALIGML